MKSDVSTNVVIGFVYVLPEKSPIYDDPTSDGISELDSKISSIKDKFGHNTDILILGDLNSRVGEHDDVLFEDESDLDYLALPEFYIPDVFQVPRSTQDQIVNKYGLALIELCKSWGMHIVNGRKPGDKVGSITCITKNGSSLVDYVIATTNCFNHVIDLIVHSRSESDHLPVSCLLEIKTNDRNIIHVETCNCPTSPILKYHWTERGKHKFTENEASACNILLEFKQLVKDDIKAATYKLEEFLHICGHHLKSKHCNFQMSDNSKEQPKWFDEECEALKRKKYDHLNRFRMSRTKENLNNYLKEMKAFRALCKTKWQRYNDKLVNDIHKANIEGDCKQFWRKIKTLLREKG